MCYDKTDKINARRRNNAVFRISKMQYLQEGKEMVG